MSNLESELIFYASYHNHKGNILTHIICVPILLWTGSVFLSYPNPITMSFLSINVYWSTIFTLLYMIYYIYLDPKAGVTITYLTVIISLYVVIGISNSSNCKLYCYKLFGFTKFFKNLFDITHR